jgi:Mitochondrial carrier protein
MVVDTKKKGTALKDLGAGAVLQCLEALTLGMPFEVWKTRMGRFREESTVRAFVNVYKAGGGGLPGVASFWAGLGPKMIESASKGAVLLWSKEGQFFPHFFCVCDPFPHSHEQLLIVAVSALASIPLFRRSLQEEVVGYVFSFFFFFSPVHFLNDLSLSSGLSNHRDEPMHLLCDCRCFQARVHTHSMLSWCLPG